MNVHVCMHMYLHAYSRHQKTVSVIHYSTVEVRSVLVLCEWKVRSTNTKLIKIPRNHCTCDVTKDKHLVFSQADVMPVETFPHTQKCSNIDEIDNSTNKSHTLYIHSRECTAELKKLACTIN